VGQLVIHVFEVHVTMLVVNRQVAEDRCQKHQILHYFVRNLNRGLQRLELDQELGLISADHKSQNA
jgi:hypothetical protein